MGFIKAITVRGAHKEVHRAAFQGMHQQPRELYQAYTARAFKKDMYGHSGCWICMVGEAMH